MGVPEKQGEVGEAPGRSAFPVDPKLRTWGGFTRFCRDQLRITNWQGEAVPLVLNPCQRFILAAEIRARRAGVHPWFIVLKSRMAGTTTLQQALAYWTTWKQPRQDCVTLTHCDDTTRSLFRVYQQFYRYQPEQYRHVKSDAFVGTLEYPGWDSLYIARTAGSGGAGRGSTFARIHLSEAAFFRDLKSTHLALAKAVTPTSTYFVESTANGTTGVGREFYQMWRAAKEGKNGFIPLFLPWHQDARNSLPITDPAELVAPGVLADMDEDERRLTERFSLRPEQVKWWRTERARLVKSGLSAEQIHQEWPSDDESCFRASEGQV